MSQLPIWFQFTTGVVASIAACGTVWILFQNMKINKENKELLSESHKLVKEGQELAETLSQQSGEIVRQGHQLTKELKRADVLMECCRRYESLVEHHHRLDSEEDSRAVAGYFKRFWLLQWDQYHFFSLGLVDERIFRFWMSERQKEFHENSHTGEVGFQQGWTDVGKQIIPDSDFIRRMELVFRGETDKMILEIRPNLASAAQPITVLGHNNTNALAP